jgi:hypothetical protein
MVFSKQQICAKCSICSEEYLLESFKISEGEEFCRLGYRNDWVQIGRLGDRFRVDICPKHKVKILIDGKENESVFKTI